MTSCELPLRFRRPEVDRRADRLRAHVERLLDAGKPDLVVGVRIRQELVVVELQHERNLVRVLARHRSEHAERRGHGVAAALDARASRCFRDRSRPGSARTTRRPNARCPDRPAGSTRSRCRPSRPVLSICCSAPSTRGVAVRRRVQPIDEIRARQVQAVAWNGLALVLQERGVGAENLLDLARCRFR